MEEENTEIEPKSQHFAEIDPILASILADEDRSDKTYATDFSKWKPGPFVSYNAMPFGYMEESFTMRTLDHAFTTPDQLLKRKINVVKNKCGEKFWNDEARLKVMTNTLKPILDDKSLNGPADNQYMRRVPGYVQVQFKVKSCLDAEQMKHLLQSKMKGTVEPVLSSEIKSEQAEFQRVLKTRWLQTYFKRPLEIEDGTKRFINELHKGRVKSCLKNFDPFYKSVGTISIKSNQETEVHFNFRSNLYQPSKKPTIKVPNPLSAGREFISLPQIYDEIKEFIRITPSVGTQSVRDDKYARKMAIDHSADMVITGSAFETLFSTDVATFNGQWMLPITVQHFANTLNGNTVKIIFVNKPLPLPKLNHHAMKKWFVKMATQQNVSNDKSNQRWNFSSGTTDENVNTESCATDNEYQKYCYRLWSLDKDVSGEGGVLMKNERNNKKSIRVLVRSRQKPINIAPLPNERADDRECVLHSTIEYVPEYGASRVPQPESLKLWLKLSLNPNSKLIRLRYERGLQLLMTESCDISRVTKDAMSEVSIPPKNNFANVYHVFESLLDYPPGNYVLSYKKHVTGAFANIYISSPECDENGLNLESVYEVCEQVDGKTGVMKCPTIDTGVLTPYHIHGNTYPALFPPRNLISKQKPFNRENWGKKKKSGKKNRKGPNTNGGNQRNEN